MTKTTIELHRIKDTTANVGHMNLPFYDDQDPAVLDAIVNWARLPDNADQKVYRHVLYHRNENLRHDPHQWNKGGPTYTHKGDYVTYLDIYHQ